MKDIIINGETVGTVHVYREKGKNKIMFLPKSKEDKAITFRSTTGLLNHLRKLGVSHDDVIATCLYVGDKLLQLKKEGKRREIQEFAEAMEEVMQKHDAEKGDSWKSMPLHTLEHLLLSEVREWNASRLRHIDGENHPKEKEVIDIANIAMMLWHRYRKEVLHATK